MSNNSSASAASSSTSPSVNPAVVPVLATLLPLAVITAVIFLILFLRTRRRLRCLKNTFKHPQRGFYPSPIPSSPASRQWFGRPSKPTYGSKHGVSEKGNHAIKSEMRIPVNEARFTGDISTNYKSKAMTAAGTIAPKGAGKGNIPRSSTRFPAYRGSATMTPTTGLRSSEAQPPTPGHTRARSDSTISSDEPSSGAWYGRDGQERDGHERSGGGTEEHAVGGSSLRYGSAIDKRTGESRRRDSRVTETRATDSRIVEHRIRDNQARNSEIRDSMLRDSLPRSHFAFDGDTEKDISAMHNLRYSDFGSLVSSHSFSLDSDGMSRDSWVDIRDIMERRGLSSFEQESTTRPLEIIESSGPHVRPNQGNENRESRAMEGKRSFDVDGGGQTQDSSSLQRPTTAPRERPRSSGLERRDSYGVTRVVAPTALEPMPGRIGSRRTPFEKGLL